MIALEGRTSVGAPPGAGLPGRSAVKGVTVIICAFNSAARLEPTLAALKRQVPPADGWDLVVVDNASTDETARVCRDCWSDSQVPMRIVSEERPGQIHARQAGIRIADREYLCFVDDDNHLCEGYLAAASEIMDRNPGVGVLGGQGSAVTSCEKPSWLWDGWQSHAVGPQAKDEGVVSDGRGFVYGAGAVIRKAALREAMDAGFVSLLTGRRGAALSSGDDVELCFALRMLGWQVYYSPRLKFDHYMPAPRMTWEYCLRLFTAYGQANAVLELYQPWLSDGRKARFKRTIAGILVHEVLELRRIRRRLRHQPAGQAGPLSQLIRMEGLGKREAIIGHLISGRILAIHRNMKRLHSRSRIVVANRSYSGKTW